MNQPPNPWAGNDYIDEYLRGSSVKLVKVARHCEVLQQSSEVAREFLGIYAFLRTAAPADFSAVWRHPYCSFWATLALDWMNAKRGRNEPPEYSRPYMSGLGTDNLDETIDRHLYEAKRIALGVAMVSGTPLMFDSPWKLSTPAAIPGTRWNVAGSDGEGIGGFDGVHMVTGSGRPINSVTTFGEGLEKSQQLVIVKAPAATCEDYELQIQPYGFNVPGMPSLPPASATTLSYQAGFENLVGEILRAIKRYQPVVYEQFRRLICWVAINPPEGVSVLNFASYSLFPGCFAARGFQSSWALASSYIHEYFHNRLFIIESTTPILTMASSRNRCYSPWRDEPRPLRGILHGAYVYSPVARYWHAVLEDDDSSSDMKNVAKDRLLWSSLTIDTGLEQLERHGEFTAYGQEFMKMLHNEADELRTLAGDIGNAETILSRIVDNDGNVSNRLDPESAAPLSVLAERASHRRANDPEFRSN